MAYKKRLHTRHETVKLPVTVRPHGTFVWSKGSVINLSRGGVQIYLPAKYNAETKLEIEFSTVDRQGRPQRRKMLATIVWKKGFKYGCKFIA